MGRIDEVYRVEQVAGDGLLDDSVENVVDDVFEVSEKAVDGVLEGGLVSPQ